MKLLIIFFFVNCSLLTSNCYCQSGWVQQSPLPFPEFSLWDVNFANRNTGFACGTMGIIRTTDSGTHWAQLNAGTAIWYMGVWFIDPNTGYACGSSTSGGVIKKTTDVGATWTTTFTAPWGMLRGVCFTDANTGYVVGDSSAVLKTTNGGVNWNYLYPSSESTRNWTVYFINGQTGFVGGFYVAKTTNGGKNWTFPNMNVYPDYFSSISFVDSNNGYVAGYGNSFGTYVYKTTDCGDNWNTLNLPGYTNSATSISFTNVNTGYLVAAPMDYATVMKTTDAGQSWKTDLIDCNLYLRSIATVDSEVGLSVGSTNEMVRTSNSGTNWLYSGYVGTGDINSVYFRNQLTGFVVGNGIAMTTNGGDPWLSPVQCYNKLFYSISFGSNLVGYAVGDSNTILKTTDGGFTWSVQTSPATYQYLQYVYFINQDTGFVLATGEQLFSTTNGGAQWNMQNLGHDLKAMCLTDANTGYIIGNLNVLKTTDGGHNWNTLNPGTQAYWRSISFPTSTIGYITGNGNIIAKTTNSGSNWTLTTLNNASGLQSVFFTSPNIGYAVGGYQNSSSEILSTTDGGENWVSQQSPNSMQLNSVFFVNDSTGYTAGYGGTIAKTINGGIPIVVNQIGSQVPDRYLLYQNYPNPFNPVTSIKYALSNRARINISIYDVIGRHVKTLVDGIREAGSYSVTFDGTDLSSGVYFYLIQASDGKGSLFTNTKRMVLLK